MPSGYRYGLVLVIGLAGAGVLLIAAGLIANHLLTLPDPPPHAKAPPPPVRLTPAGSVAVVPSLPARPSAQSSPTEMGTEAPPASSSGQLDNVPREPEPP